MKTYKDLINENDELRSRIKVLESKIITLTSWKGQDTLSISKTGDTWTVIEHRKDKDTLEVKETEHIISHYNVRVMWTIIKKLVPGTVDSTCNYRDIVPVLIKHYKIKDANDESFNGGVNRAKYYFPYYYYPLKILEDLGYIHYGGRGTVARKK